MPSPLPISPTAAVPLAWVGRQALGGISYVGGLGVLLADSIRALRDSRLTAREARAMLGHELAWILGMGLPLVALVHVGMGSFLSMQAYFGGTFVDGAGAVVGVGLVRNIAPLMASLTLAGLLAARITPDLRARRRAARPSEPASTANRPGAIDQLVAARIVAGAVAGPVLALWGALVGTVVGWQVAQTILGVSTHSFFLMFWDLLWLLDVIGLAVKGVAFGLVAGLFACHEGMRVPAVAPEPARDSDLGQPTDADANAACRAACLAVLMILVLNSGWFIVFYHAGTAFGPTLLKPPSR